MNSIRLTICSYRREYGPEECKGRNGRLRVLGIQIIEGLWIGNVTPDEDTSSGIVVSYLTIHWSTRTES